MDLFQSHIGSITTVDRLCDATSDEQFQSHIGSITTETESATISSNARFNPTLVRLRRGKAYDER